MRFTLALTIYRLLLPLLFLAAFPGWIVKMLRRGGFGTRLEERAAVYMQPVEFEPCGAVHVHAVSVGESLLALKLIREWRLHEPERRFVLATGTATGHAVASAANLPDLRITYAPLDFTSMVHSYLERFEPSQIVLIEGEVWPHLLLACKKRGIPVSLVNARMSPRSSRRYRKFAGWVRPLFSMLDSVAIQDPGDDPIWQDLGVMPERIHHTGSLKFDPGSGARPTTRVEFQQMLDAFGKNRPVILAASTFPGEEVLIASAVRTADPNALAVIVPRHAERRAEVVLDLEKAGFLVALRSSGGFAASSDRRHVFVIDTTGELRDWTAHADAVIIGKSFLSTGGQNPCEAILAGKPLIIGSHMENFQPLASQLLADGGCLSASGGAGLSQAILTAMDPRQCQSMTVAASALLVRHDGATRRIVERLSVI